MRRHVYTCAKGYDEQYKGREVSWDVPETVAEAIQSGEFPDEKTLVRYAVGQLNIRKGHAIQDATVEKVKDDKGKDTATLANPNLTLSDMEKIARETKATASERAPKGTGGQAARAKAYATTKEKAKQMAENASPEKLATLLELGMIEQGEYDARIAAIGGESGKSKRASR